MKNIQKDYLRLIGLWILGSCLSIQSASSQADGNLMKTYQEAVEDASLPEKTEIYRKLTVISDQNQQLTRKTINQETYILAVAWKAAKDTVYYKNNDKGFYNTGKRDLWITIVPDLVAFAKQKDFLVSGENPHLRLQQLLGLPPDKGEVTKRAFIEFWIRPQDIFRPCPDAEIDDKACECIDKVPNSTPEHNNWIHQYRKDSYNNDNPYYRFPWTQLGYTYDWNERSKEHVGLSEFVVKQEANIIVHQIKMTKDYLSK